MELIVKTSMGMYCPVGDFYIDPKGPVKKSIITHAHADHISRGASQYYCSTKTKPLLVTRGLFEVNIKSFDYSEAFEINGVKISLHPAGHILGSAQVRLEYQNDVWVVSGDYKREKDPTCDPFEIVKCNVFITESTFALPIYVWPDIDETANEIYEWWTENLSVNKASVIFAYSLGKSQRIIGELRKITDKEIYVHPTIAKINQDYEKGGIYFKNILDTAFQKDIKGLVIAPPSVSDGTWMNRFKDVSTAFASGWMMTSAGKKQRGYDRGYVISDHCDWPALIESCLQTDATRVIAHHGYKENLERYLREQEGISTKDFENYKKEIL